MRYLPLAATVALFAAAGAGTLAAQSGPDEVAAVTRLLSDVRGAAPLYCELASRAVDGRVWWSSSGSGSGGALEVDSSAAALVRWIHTGHDDARVVPRLSAAMRDPDACVRRVAGSMLGQVKHASARAALLSALDDADAGTRAVAAIGLGVAEHAAALRPLLTRLRDGSAAVRRAAAWALGELEHRDAMLPLIDVLANDADARVRQAAATALGKVTG